MRRSDFHSSREFRNQSSRDYEGASSQEAPDKKVMEVDIPRSLAGLVIGHKGSTTKRIMRKTGVYAYVDIPNRDDGRTFVKVRGTHTQVHHR